MNKTEQVVKIELTDRLDRVYELSGCQGQLFKNFLLVNYIPSSSIILKVNGCIINDHNYKIDQKDVIELKMVRAYQLPEYCQMLELWNKQVDPNNSDSNDSLYTNKILWFNDNGICELKQAHISKSDYTSWLEKKFVDSICISQIIEKNDHICLPLSGGRDSLALLYLLERTKSKLPSFTITGVTVAPTVASSGDLKIATEAIQNLGVKDYHILNADFVKDTLHLKNDFKKIMDKAINSQGRGVTISLWHNIMKTCIERFCRENNLKKISYGYQFEDLMASLLRSTLLGIFFGESMQRKSLGNFDLIFPLWSITKKELTIYLDLIAPQSHSTQSNPSQYDRGDHNRDIHYFLADTLSTLYPGIGYSLFIGHAEFNQRYVKKTTFYKCSNCQSTFPESHDLDNNLCFACDYFYRVGEL